MPIYAYKCSTCGYAKDVLQKLSDPLLTRCPECGAETFGKQVTAAGFQLKGSGWYVTDFRDGGKKPESKPGSSEKGEGGKSDGKSESQSEIKGSESGDGGKAGNASATPAPAAAPAPAPAAAPAVKKAD